MATCSAARRASTHSRERCSHNRIDSSVGVSSAVDDRHVVRVVGFEPGRGTDPTSAARTRSSSTGRLGDRRDLAIDDDDVRGVVTERTEAELVRPEVLIVEPTPNRDPGTLGFDWCAVAEQALALVAAAFSVWSRNSSGLPIWWGSALPVPHACINRFFGQEAHGDIGVVCVAGVVERTHDRNRLLDGLAGGLLGGGRRCDRGDCGRRRDRNLFVVVATGQESGRRPRSARSRRR